MRPFWALAAALLSLGPALNAVPLELKLDGSFRVLSLYGQAYRVPARPSFAGHIVPCDSQLWGLALDGDKLSCGEQPPKRLISVKAPLKLLGYAADGHPIYNNRGPKNSRDLKSETITVEPGYRKKKDGKGFEYDESLGHLDECNGREGVTPEYPLGTYYYVLTDSYPYVPHCWKGTPDESFEAKKPRARAKARQTAVIESSMDGAAPKKKVDPGEIF